MEDDIIKCLGQIKEKELVELCQNLIKIPSHKDTFSREKEIALFLKDLMEREGIEVVLQEAAEGRSNVIGRLRGTGKGPNLLFNGHMDTVPPLGMKNPLWAITICGKIWGRGAVDMKSGLAGMTYALIAIKRTGIKLKGNLILGAVVGEENISEGTQRLIEGGCQYDTALVGEPTDLQIVIAHKGIEWIEITIKGKASHASIPKEGINAIVNAARLVCVLEEKLVPKLSQTPKSNRLVGSPTLNIGKIWGGVRNSVVPDLCKIQLDRRTLPGEKIEDVLSEIRSVIRQLENTYAEFKAEVNPIPVGPDTREQLEEIGKQGLKIPPHEPMEISRDSKIVRALSKAFKYVPGRNPEIAGMSGWTDASLLVNRAKIPTAVFGPGPVIKAHTTEEYVNIADLVDAAKVYAVTAVEVCSGKINLKTRLSI